MATLVRDAHAYVWHVAEVVSAWFSHTSATFTYNEDLYEWLGSRWFKSFMARNASTLAPCVATGHPLRRFGSTISRSPWLVQLRGCNESVDCEDLSGNGIELKQTTLHYYSQVNTSNGTLDRWSQPRFFDQMANRSSWRPLWVPEIWYSTWRARLIVTQRGTSGTWYYGRELDKTW